jgi:phosphoribosylanthranilate isomerase
MIQVKICGITRVEDALLAVDLGASAVGFIFYSPSPRYVDPKRVAEIVRKLPPFVTTVGVFVNEQANEMNRIVSQCGLDRVQLHGDEPYETLDALSRPAYRAFRIGQEADLDALEHAPDRTVLLDSYQSDRYGGTGKTFDWSWARRCVDRLGQQGRRVILAGGLTPEIIATALQAVSPHALDVSSGVEAAPGVKDERKLRALFRALDEAQRGEPQMSSRHANAT